MLESFEVILQYFDTFEKKNIKFTMKMANLINIW